MEVRWTRIVRSDDNMPKNTWKRDWEKRDNRLEVQLEEYWMEAASIT